MKTLIVWVAALIFAGTDLFPQTNSTNQTNSPQLITPVAQPEMMSLIPAFPVANMQRAVEFYTRLGFTVILQSGANYTSMGRDLVRIGLALDKSPQRANKASCYINMTMIDDYYNAVKAGGTKITNELKTQPSNMREFMVTDPDGNTLMFGQYMGAK